MTSRQTRSYSTTLTRPSCLTPLCTNIATLLRHGRSNNPLQNDLSAPNPQRYHNKESSSQMSRGSCYTTLNTSESSVSPGSVVASAHSIVPEAQSPPDYYQLQQQTFQQHAQEQLSSSFLSNNRHSLLYSALPSPKLAKTVQGTQLHPPSSSPTSNTDVAISPAYLCSSASFPSPSPPRFSTVSDVGSTARPLTKQQLEWCIACCSRALDQTERMPPTTALTISLNEVLQLLVGLFAECSYFYSPSPSPSSSSPSSHSPLTSPNSKPNPSASLPPSYSLLVPKQKTSLSRLRSSSSSSSLFSSATPSSSSSITSSPCIQTAISTNRPNEPLVEGSSRPVFSRSLSASSFVSSTHSAIAAASVILQPLTKKQILDLTLFIYSKAPRNLAAEVPHWVGLTHVERDEDHYCEEEFDLDMEDEEGESWSLKSLVGFSSLPLPPWRAQILGVFHQGVGDDTVASAADDIEEGISKRTHLSEKRLKTKPSYRCSLPEIKSATISQRDEVSTISDWTPPAQQAKGVMLSAVIQLPEPSAGHPAASNPEDKWLPSAQPLVLTGSKTAKKESVLSPKVKYDHRHEKSRDDQECCEPSSPLCYNYKSSYWQYQARRRTRQRFGSKTKEPTLSPLPGSKDNGVRRSSARSIGSSVIENKAIRTTTGLRVKNEALDEELIRVASRKMKEVQIVPAKKLGSLIASSSSDGTLNSKYGSTVSVWPTQRIYTLRAASATTLYDNSLDINEDEGALSSGSSPTVGSPTMPLNMPVSFPRNITDPLAIANTPPRVSSLNAHLHVAAFEELTLTLGPLPLLPEVTASARKSKKRAPPPIVTTGLLVLGKASATTGISPTNAMSPYVSFKDAALISSKKAVKKSVAVTRTVDHNNGKISAKKVVGPCHRFWETSLMALRRKGTPTSLATKIDTSTTLTSAGTHVRALTEIPSVFVSTPLRLPSFESRPDANTPTSITTSSTSLTKGPRSRHTHSKSHDFADDLKHHQRRIPLHYHQCMTGVRDPRGGPGHIKPIMTMYESNATAPSPTSYQRYCAQIKGEIFESPAPFKLPLQDNLVSSVFSIPDDYMSMTPPSSSMLWSTPTPLHVDNGSSSVESTARTPILSTNESPVSVEEFNNNAPHLLTPPSVTRKKSIHEKLFGARRKSLQAPCLSPYVSSSLPPKALSERMSDQSKNGNDNGNSHDHNYAKPHAHSNDHRQLDSPSHAQQYTDDLDSLASMSYSSALASVMGLLTTSSQVTLHPTSTPSSGSRCVTDHYHIPHYNQGHHQKSSSVRNGSSFDSICNASLGITTVTSIDDYSIPQSEMITSSEHRLPADNEVQSRVGLGSDKDRQSQRQHLQNQDAVVSAPRIRKEARKQREEEYVARVMDQWQNWARTYGSSLSA